MKSFFLLILFLCTLKADEFITAKEYAKALYNNPRGISCKACHGVDGKEQILSYYYKDGKKIPFIIPAINELSFKYFKTFMNKERGVRSVMPSYSLTKGELGALYYYIQNQRKKDEK